MFRPTIRSNNVQRVGEKINESSTATGRRGIRDLDEKKITKKEKKKEKELLADPLSEYKLEETEKRGHERKASSTRLGFSPMILETDGVFLESETETETETEKKKFSRGFAESRTEMKLERAIKRKGKLDGIRRIARAKGTEKGGRGEHSGIDEISVAAAVEEWPCARCKGAPASAKPTGTGTSVIALCAV
uniref:Uncharacterized protein n=1 Tax=Vespula pensylvanica TaxID=30213 RepID=A0A834P6Y5_VESPE|nr:hypothetical protein H0235_006470 [Vespula pensylvanica]